MSYLFQPPPPVVLPTVHGELLPVHRIYCVGRNYAAHVREMGFNPDREEPFFFMKPADAIVQPSDRVPYPSMTSDFQHEVELVVAIGRAGQNIPLSSAPDHVLGYAVGLDMTRRDLQLAARDRGRPWEFGKSFDASAPCGRVSPVASVPSVHEGKGRISLDVNGSPRQSSDLAHMVWSVPEIIAYLSHYVSLLPGDLIYTGTPDKVGPVASGDLMTARIEGLETLEIRVE